MPASASRRLCRRIQASLWNPRCHRRAILSTWKTEPPIRLCTGIPCARLHLSLLFDVSDRFVHSFSVQLCSHRLWVVTVTPPFTPLLNVPITGLTESGISTFTKADFVLPYCCELERVFSFSGVPFSLPAVPGPLHPPGTVHYAYHGCKNSTLYLCLSFSLSLSLFLSLSLSWFVGLSGEKGHVAASMDFYGMSAQAHAFQCCEKDPETPQTRICPIALLSQA